MRALLVFLNFHNAGGKMISMGILLVLLGQTWAEAYDRFFFMQEELYSCNDTAYAIACDTVDDAYVVVGHTDQGPLGGLDVLVTKLNAIDGSVLWSRAYGLPGFPEEVDDYGRSVIVDYGEDEVCYAIAGYTKPGFFMSNSDALVFKIRATDGSLVWGNLYMGFYYVEPDWVYTDDYAYSIIKDGGDYLVAGNIESYTYQTPCGGFSDALVFKVDAMSGMCIWSRAYGKMHLVDPPQPKDDYAYSIIEDSSTTPCNLFVVAGKSSLEMGWLSDILVFKGKKIDGCINPASPWLYDYGLPPWVLKCAYSIKNDPHLGGYILTGDVDTSIVVMRLNPNLSVGWGGTGRIYSIPNLANSRCIQPTSDSNYVFTGFTAPGLTASDDLLTTKIDQNGVILWSKVLAGCQGHGTGMSDKDFGQWIVECPPDTYVAAGYTDWPSQSSWIPTNLLVARMDVNGNIPCWQYPDTCMKDIETLVDIEEVYVDSSYCECEIGMELVEIVDSLVEVRDSVICKSPSVGIEGESHSRIPIIYGVRSVPNPHISETTIYYNLTVGCDVRLTIYDMTGRLVRTLVAGHIEAGEHAVVWDGRDEEDRRLAQGIYFCRIQSGNQTEEHKVILMR